jgi:[ribosomal protein S18]-alanine N-acetyltransferase
MAESRPPTASPVLRDYRPHDFRRLWEIDQQCFAPGIAYSQRELAHYVGMRGAFVIVAENDGGANQDAQRRIVGFLVAQKQTRGAGHIVTIDVLPEVRRAGLGSLLMAECEQRLRRAGCSVIYLETAVDNDIALRFYHRHGYSVLKTIPRYYLNSLDALQLGKKL